MIEEIEVKENKVDEIEVQENKDNYDVPREFQCLIIMCILCFRNLIHVLCF